MDHARLQKIYAEAGRLFDWKGYAGTKMAEIAKASDVAVGTMYAMFTGKEAVFSFVIMATLDKNWLSEEPALPMKAVDTPILLSKLREVLDLGFGSLLVITASDQTLCKDFYTLLEELFDYFADYLLAFNNIERNAGVVEELFQEFHPRRQLYFETMEDCVRRYMDAGQIRPLDYIPSHVRFITDTLTWWALNSGLSLPKLPIPREKAKEICLGILKSAYCRTVESSS